MLPMQFLSKNSYQKFQGQVNLVLRLELDVQKLIKIQNKLRKRIIINVIENLKTIKFVAGVDAAYFNEYGIGAVVIIDYFSFNILDRAYYIQKIKIPYKSTFLCFRELPLFLGAFNKLKIKPDILFVDGHGIAHPRQFGCATHLGLLLDIPSIGIAKKMLYGVINENPKKVGTFTNIYSENMKKIIGAVVKTSNAKPIYVSPGYKIDIKTSISLTLRFCKYKIPEPIRLADAYANEIKRRIVKKSPDLLK